MTVNPGAALRDWLNARDVRRWERSGAWPPTVDRTYWTAYEYQRDLGRLQARRYNVSQQRSTPSFPDLAPNVTTVGPRRVRAQGGHRALLYRVSYERVSYAAWARVVGLER